MPTDITPKYNLVSAKERVFIPEVPVPFGQSVGGLKVNASSVQQGEGNNIFKISERGIHLGAADFDDAPWRVAMDGTQTITGSSDIVSGTIAGLTITATSLTATAAGNATIVSSGATAFSAGPAGSPTFTVTQAGVMTATGATVTGTITATAGAIGGFDIGADYIRDVANSFGLASTVTGGDDVRFWAGATFANRATATFRITEAGVLTATSGTFGAWTISGNTFSTTGNNVFIGINSGGSITSGTGNITLGQAAGQSLTSGALNVLIGSTAGQNIATSSQNVVIGNASGGSALGVPSNFSEVTIVGASAGGSLTGDQNTLIGYQAGFALSSGIGNTFVGKSAGATHTTGNGNVLVGGGADVASGSLTGSIALGTNTSVTASNQLVIGSQGSYAINDIYIGGGVTGTVPQNIVYNATGGSGANVVGANLTLAAGKSTGSAAGGSLFFATSPAGGAGSSLNALVTALTIDSTGAFTFAGAGGIDFASKAMTNVNIDSGTITGITDLAFADGGTGISSWTQYLIPYAATTTSIGQIAIGTSGQVLTSNGAGAAPTFQTISTNQSLFVPFQTETGGWTGHDNSATYITIPDATTTSCLASFFVPSGATIASIQIIVRAESSAAGNFFFSANLQDIGDNEASAADDGGASVAYADCSSSTNWQLVTVATTDYDGLATGKSWFLRFDFERASASDTLNGVTLRAVGCIITFS